MLNILLAEDHNIVRNGIRMLLETDKDINVVGEVTNGRAAIEYIAKGGSIDVVLADMNMPELDGISMIRELKETNPEISVVILSMHDNDQYISQAFKEGASGYLLKNINADEMIFAIKHVRSGAKYLCSELVMTMLDKLHNGHFQYHTLAQSGIEFSLREIEVLHLIADGLTNKEMSDKLFISKRTIEGHRQSLVKKTGSSNTAALIRFAILHGIIQ